MLGNAYKLGRLDIYSSSPSPTPAYRSEQLEDRAEASQRRLRRAELLLASEPSAAWFRGTRVRHEGRIWAVGVEKDVLLVETYDMNDEIDAAYRTKYHRYAASIIDAIVSPQARAATLKLVPRS